MESHLICEPYDNRQFIKVFHNILNIPEEELFTPSHYLAEIKMSVEQRLENLIKTRKNQQLEEPTPFLFTPNIIIFQNFIPGRSYNATLTLQNKEQSSRCVRVHFEPSVYFKLLHPSKVVWTKVAPGMLYQLTVSFTGDEMKDYKHQITFFTEEEQFTIPVYAFQPRPMVDFPDLVTMPDVPVNMVSEKNIILHNYGTVLAAFNLLTTEQCTVCPLKAILEPGEKIFLKLKFKTTTVGTERTSIIVKFQDGIRLKVNIESNAISSSVSLERDFIIFDGTFMGLQKHTSVTLRYQGQGRGYFKWKTYKSTEEEKTRKSLLKTVFKQVRDSETVRCVPLKMYNIVSGDDHAAIYQRIFKDEVEEVEKSEEFLFGTSAFRIIPQTGDIGPTGTLDFTVIFSPLRCEKYETFAFLEISGKEHRLPLKLTGSGLGPNLRLNIAKLSAGNIFLYSQHHYEIVIANAGHIPGSLSFVKKELEFGGKISCTPETSYIASGHYSASVISFSPRTEGKFIETIEFIINESKEILHFIITGDVTAPLLSLDVKEINFGMVAFGERKSKEIKLVNSSPVPIPYYVEVNLDGYQSAVDYEAFLNGCSLCPPYPKEFTFTPERGVVEAETTLTGSVGNRQLMELLPMIMSFSVDPTVKYHRRND